MDSDYEADLRRKLETAGSLVFLFFCILPPLVMNGFLLDLPLNWPLVFICSIIGGAFGGALMCPRPVVAGFVGGLIAGPLGLTALFFYTQHRESIWMLELMIVQGIACAPGIGICFLLKKVLSKPKNYF